MGNILLICTFVLHVIVLFSNLSQHRNLTSYSLAQKYDIILHLSKGQKSCKLSKDSGVPKDCISKWAKPENNSAECLEWLSGIRAYFQTSGSVLRNILSALTLLEDDTVPPQLLLKIKQCQITYMFLEKDKPFDA